MERETRKEMGGELGSKQIVNEKGRMARTWNSLSSAGSKTPSLLMSHSLKILRRASTHFGLRVCRKRKTNTRRRRSARLVTPSSAPLQLHQREVSKKNYSRVLSSRRGELKGSRLP